MEEEKDYVIKVQKKIELDLDKLEKALIIYDRATDTLHINLSDEEADEIILLENGVIVRVKGELLVGLSVQNISKFS